MEKKLPGFARRWHSPVLLPDAALVSESLEEVPGGG